MSTKPMIQILQGAKGIKPPVWVMRQAGRYLPEYRDVRAKAGSFLGLVHNPERAAEVTMQPIRRFGFDAAILFSDILVVPQALGVDVQFTEGEGPKLKSVTTLDHIGALKSGTASHYWQNVMETVMRVRGLLSEGGFEHTALIGFSGGPWTVACYMVQGDAKDREFDAVRRLAFGNPEFFDRLIDVITDVTIEYLAAQIRSGAEIIQIFESWACVAGGGLFDRYVLAPITKIVTALKSEFPHVPIIGFPRNSGVQMVRFAQGTGINALACDQMVDLTALRTHVGPDLVLQGNMDPLALLVGGDAMNAEIDRVLNATKFTPHIFNLGHGILPGTPVEHVGQLVERIRAHAA